MGTLPNSNTTSSPKVYQHQKLDVSEIKDLLICFLHILKHLPDGKHFSIFLAHQNRRLIVITSHPSSVHHPSIHPHIWTTSLWNPWANFLQTSYGAFYQRGVYTNGHGPLSKMATMHIYGKTLKNLPLQNKESFEAESLALVTQGLQSLFKW